MSLRILWHIAVIYPCNDKTSSHRRPHGVNDVVTYGDQGVLPIGGTSNALAVVIQPFGNTRTQRRVILPDHQAQECRL